MSTTGTSERIILRTLAWSIVAFLGLFAWRFAEERLYTDSGYYLARVINEGWFHVEHGRWVLVFSQLLPFIGLKLGLAMKALILLHSLNNIVWLAACMAFALRVLRDERAALLLALTHLIGLTHGLFCPIYELYYGVDLLILVHALWRSDQPRSAWKWGFMIVAFALTISSHFFTALLAVAFFSIDRLWRDRRTFLVLLTTGTVVLLARMITISAYERDGLAFLKQLLHPTELLGLFTGERFALTGSYLFTHYADVCLLSVLVVIGLRRKATRLEFILFIAVLLSLYVLISLRAPDFVHDRYREQFNFAVIAWVLFVAVRYLMTGGRWRTIVLIAFCLCAALRMVEAERMAPYYTERTALIEAEIATARDVGMSKAIVSAQAYFGPPDHLIDLSWSTPVESLLLSAEAGPSATVSLITTGDLATAEVKENLDHLVFRRWDVMDSAWLNPLYFNPPQGRYVLLPAQ